MSWVGSGRVWASVGGAAVGRSVGAVTWGAVSVTGVASSMVDFSWGAWLGAGGAVVGGLSVWAADN